MDEDSVVDLIPASENGDKSVDSESVTDLIPESENGERVKNSLEIVSETSGSDHWGIANGSCEPQPTPTASRTDTSRKRSHSVAFSHRDRQFSRAKRLPGSLLTQEYIDLLNYDIQDAVTHFAPSCKRAKKQISPSQIGLSYWTTIEKNLFFEALGRLGIDDIPGIARRVGTKAELEIAHYLDLLHQQRASLGSLQSLALADVPAAVELSPACCTALEAVADKLSLQQEDEDEAHERRKWGGFRWVVHQMNGRRVHVSGKGEGEARPFPAAHLFNLPNWLQLSERVFMNAADPEGSWRHVGSGQEGNPALRPCVYATALEDFYALVVSVTRRLVAATVFVTEARLKLKAELASGKDRVVWPREVDAAAMSLGMMGNRHEFWGKAARRLGLVVRERGEALDEEGDEERDEERGEVDLGGMAYDDVESALGVSEHEAMYGYYGGDPDGEDGYDEDGDQTQDGVDDQDEDEEMQDRLEESSDPEDAGKTPLSEAFSENPYSQGVHDEASELLHYTALRPGAFYQKDSLLDALQIEHEHEGYADTLDARASYREETRLWRTILSRASPPSEAGLPKKVEMPRPPELPLAWSRHVLQEMCPRGGYERLWRNSVRAAATGLEEWEEKWEEGEEEEQEGEQEGEEEEKQQKKEYQQEEDDAVVKERDLAYGAGVGRAEGWTHVGAETVSECGTEVTSSDEVESRVSLVEASEDGGSDNCE